MSNDRFISPFITLILFIIFALLKELRSPVALSRGTISQSQKENFFFFYKFIYLFIFGCVGSSFLCEGFL